jgi:hypothetical protein
MLLTSWLHSFLHRIERHGWWKARARRQTARVIPVAAEIQLLETRQLLSSVLADTTPVTTRVVLEGASTGNVVLAAFTDANPAGGAFTTLNPPGAYQSKATATAVSGNNVVGVYWDSSNIRHAFLYNGSGYTTLTPPGTSVEGTGYQAGTTYATGVSGNSVVGWYLDSSMQTHGFLYNGSTYTTLDPPGSVSSTALAVSGNNVVGTFTNASGVSTGFLYDGSTYTTLLAPQNLPTNPAAVSGGNVVGTYSQGGSDHGFLFDGTNYTTIDVPGGFNTTPTGVSGTTVVGVYYVNGSYHRFSYDGTTFNAQIDPPLSGAYYYSSQTGTTAIDGSNIAGSYIDPNGNYNGFLRNGSTDTIIDPPGATWTQVTGISGNEIVGEYYGTATNGIVEAFVYKLPPVPINFTPTVNWGGALVGTPTVAVQMVSQSATGSTWEVVGNATYAVRGNFHVGVTVNDNSGDSVQTSNLTIAVLSLDGEYAASLPGKPTTLASVSQNGAQLTLTGASTTTAVLTSPTTLVVGTSDSATYGNSQINFGSTGTFANQVWTKLDLPTNFISSLGGPAQVIQNGASLQFVNNRGQTSAGSWISPTQVVATAFGNETGTFQSGRLVWSTGEVWTENLVLHGTKSGAGTTTISAGSRITVDDYTINGGTAHVVQTGTNTLVFINEWGSVVLGNWISATQARVPAWNNDVATFSAGRINWSDGSLWTGTTTAAPQVTVTDYTISGRTSHLIESGTGTLVFINEWGSIVLGNWISPTRALVPAWNNDVATFSGGRINWSDGSLWTENAPQALPVTVIDYINVGNGLTAHVVQNGMPTVTFVNEHGSVVPGVMTDSSHATVAAWRNDVATFANGRINWSDGSVWIATVSQSAKLTIKKYADLADGLTAHLVQTGTPTAVFVNQLGAMVLGTFTSSTRAIVAAWNSDVATFAGANINWSDGSVWNGLTTAVSPVVTLIDSNGAVSTARLLSATTLMGLAGPLQGVSGTRQGSKIVWANGEVWDNFDFNALNALFEMGTQYP